MSKQRVIYPISVFSIASFAFQGCGGSSNEGMQKDREKFKSIMKAREGIEIIMKLDP